MNREEPAVPEKSESPQISLSSSVRVPQHVVYRALTHETVVLDLHKGIYHGLNRTAGRMLEMLEQTETVREAAAKVAEEYTRGVPEVERDMTEFCAQLLERGLIEVDES